MVVGSRPVSLDYWPLGVVCIRHLRDLLLQATSRESYREYKTSTLD
jgi:hypothetical protein